MDAIAGLGDDWIAFQRANIAENMELVDIGQQAKIEVPAIKHFDIETIVTPGTVDPSRPLGLANEVPSVSANIIKQQFETYIGDIRSRVTGFENDIISLVNKAFPGSDQSRNIETLLRAIYGAVANLATSHKSIFDAIDQLLANYETFVSNENTNIQSATSNVENTEFGNSLTGN